MSNEPASIDWRKSTRSSGGANNCVEIGFATSAVLIRDTKDRDSGTLAVSPDVWHSFLSTLKHT
ncbi:protein of unknown function [Actinopolyspora mzabensis]|uniref:DUF397 domain-containing protein n=1 Tax=Actinopolyspora mzabensis TaxID=995066 RepID=A0A1G9DG72_ACTMZ|nr:DUF397 domain-containing protein [Actinopolyspora mzabensis]SDK62859.1 protein of unknown function [Actinopolyspora mzabensis]